MKAESPYIVVIDGHDGAGKTTLATKLAAELNGRYVKPFGGSLGDMIAWLWQRSRFREADALARAALEMAIAESKEDEILVFDRHWLTMYSVLPEEYWPGWEPRPRRTILCWCDVPTTVERLTARGEPAGEISVHAYYCDVYADLARRFQIPIIDTSALGPDDTLDQARSCLRR